MASAKPFKLKICDKIDQGAKNPNLKKVVIEILERQPNLLTIKWIYKVDSSRELELNFSADIFFELYGIFHPITPHNSF